jgi:hypothetical protein
MPTAFVTQNISVKTEMKTLYRQPYHSPHLWAAPVSASSCSSS